LCLICDPPDGVKIRRCHYCHRAFWQEIRSNYHCCTASCEWLLETHERCVQWPWPKPERPDPAVDCDPGSGAVPRVCINCGRTFIPNLGRGLPGHGRAAALLRLQPEQLGLMDLTVTLRPLGATSWWRGWITTKGASLRMRARR